MDTPLPPDNNAKPQQVTPTFRVDPVTQQRLPEKPRRVRSGIRLATKEDPPVFGWLGTLFLQEFEGAFDAMGIEEGHMYARSGQTKAINIEAGAIAIRVQGRREGAYNLSIAVPILKEEDVERMTRAFVDQAIHGARVIAGEMMPETNELLNSLGIRLLPMLSECVISCSCEYEDPMCKHLRCAVLLLAQIFDKEPMLAFRLRGVETAELTEELRRLRTERAGGQRVTALLGRDDGRDDVSGDAVAEQLDTAQTYAAQPLLRAGYATGAMLDRSGQDIDVSALHQGYLKALRRAGGILLTDSPVSGVQRLSGIWQVTAGREHYSAPVVINAAGAWADKVGALAGAETIGLIPKRRTALMIASPQASKTDPLPLTVDIEEQFYLKPDAGRLLISPANQDPEEPSDVQPDELDVAICIDRIERAFDLSVRRVENKWAGLRNFVTDKSPVVGWSDQAEGFFWLAGQGGYGIQTAPALARSMQTSSQMRVFSSLQINTPANTSLWPLIAFVAECMTMSAPKSRGCERTGVAAVESTTSSAPRASATSLHAAISTVFK